MEQNNERPEKALSEEEPGKGETTREADQQAMNKSVKDQGEN